jgi:hypothetical protein
LTGGSRRWAEALLCQLTLSSNFLSGLRETDAIVLHCASPRGVAPVDEFPGAAGITPRGERHRPAAVRNENTPFFSRQQLPAAGFNFLPPRFMLKTCLWLN